MKTISYGSDQIDTASFIIALMTDDQLERVLASVCADAHPDDLKSVRLRFEVPCLVSRNGYRWMDRDRLVSALHTFCHLKTKRTSKNKLEGTETEPHRPVMEPPRTTTVEDGVIVEMDIAPVAFVKLDHRSYELLMSGTMILAPIQLEDAFYGGVSIGQAESFSEDAAESPEVRDLLARILTEAKRRGFEGYLFLSER